MNLAIHKPTHRDSLSAGSGIEGLSATPLPSSLPCELRNDGERSESCFPQRPLLIFPEEGRV